jgi:hypothetical protein
MSIASRYSPLVGTSRQPRIFMNVDLPERTVMMAGNSPSGLLLILRPARASMSPAGKPC